MMSTFEYISVLVSIILGMGIARLVAGIAAVVARWQQVSLYWPHAVLVLLVFVLHIQEWWAFFDLRSYEAWRLPVFLFVVLYPINLYILAHLLFPVRWKKQQSLREFYHVHYRTLYLFLAVLIGLAIVDNVFIGGYRLADQWAQGLLLIPALVMTLTKNVQPWLHGATALLLLAFTVAALAITWNSLVLPQ
ncbi:MAG: hypothetical protein MUC38_00200 [Cyclobacteriaceae bacterium]|jgi:hypothetical protein|nr:hypothetical protein [Cyclobacteriaceae bacterium]